MVDLPVSAGSAICSHGDRQEAQREQVEAVESMTLKAPASAKLHNLQNRASGVGTKPSI